MKSVLAAVTSSTSSSSSSSDQDQTIRSLQMKNELLEKKLATFQKDAKETHERNNQLEELLAIADLFVLPSEKESFGLSALEAMACEVPVISSNTGGLPEVNIDGLTGYTSNIGDVADMAEKALRLLKDEALHAQFSAAALAQAQSFALDNIVPKYEDFYAQIIAKESKYVPSED